MQKKAIWIDMVTAPDVPFFRPIIKEIEARERLVPYVTGREYLEVPELVRKYGLSKVRFVDCFYGKNRYSKAVATLVRAAQLYRFSGNLRPAAGFSFGSRSQTLACWWRRFKCINMFDYEGGEVRLIRWLSHQLLVPEEFRGLSGLPPRKTIYYPGLKESIYAGDFQPDTEELVQAGIDLQRVCIVLRLNSVYAHYHYQEASAHSQIDLQLIDHLSRRPEVCVVVLPRYDFQRAKVAALRRERSNLVLLERPVRGQNLIWHADGVISGGGSMIREAVCLGTPAYDIFNGPLGAVERSLIESGSVVKLYAPSDFEKIGLQKIPLARKRRHPSTLLTFVVDTLERLLA